MHGTIFQSNVFPSKSLATYVSSTELKQLPLLMIVNSTARTVSYMRTVNMVIKKSLKQQKIATKNGGRTKASAYVAPYHCKCWLPLQYSLHHYYIKTAFLLFW